MEDNMIGVVIVLYNPQPEDKANVAAMAQCNAGVIVDNSAIASMEASEGYIGKMMYVALCENKGIAEAQNIGVRLLAKKNVRYIVFLDQDSRCPMGYCESIVADYKRIKTREPRLALLGPTVTNSATNEDYQSCIHREHFDDEGFSIRRDVISSGACVEKSVLDDVGLNDEGLFIDFVDFEWCWRAENKGYVCGVTRNVTLNHHVGQSELKIGAYRVIISSPLRYYYQYRNHLWLCRRRYVPLQWKIATGIKHIARLVYLPWLVDDGMRVWRNMLKGIADSFR